MEDYLCFIMKTNADNLGQAGSPIPPCALVLKAQLGLDQPDDCYHSRKTIYILVRHVIQAPHI